MAVEQLTAAELGIQSMQAKQVANRLRLVRGRALRDAGQDAELIAAHMKLLVAIEDEVEAAHGVQGAGGPDPGLAPLQRRGALARELRHQLSAELGVLRVEALGAEEIGERTDLVEPRPKRLGHTHVLKI